MILVKLNEPDFEYDIHSLIKAFYPEQEVKVLAKSEAEQMPDSSGDPAPFLLEISYLRGTAQETDASGSITFFLKPADPKDGVLQTEGNPKNDILQAEEDPKNGTHGTLWFRRADGVDFSDRRETKNRLKHTLYRLLCDYTGRQLPWGELTGIRPVRLPMALLKKGASVREAADALKEEHFVSEEKAMLASRIAQTERRVLSELGRNRCTAADGNTDICRSAAADGTADTCRNAAADGTADTDRNTAADGTASREDRLLSGYSLYIGIPFCPTTCAYCSFASYPAEKFGDRMDAYLDALMREIRFAAELMGPRPDSVYIGGGTPTALSAAQLDRLLSAVAGQFDLNRACEVTVEAGRPDSITEEKLRVLKSYPVSRISINPQTMKQATLDLIGRRHTVEQFLDSYALARRLGFDNINMDLIVGLPEETPEDVAQTMREVRRLAPENVTVHSLAIKRASRLRIDREAFRDYQMINTPEMIRMTQTACEEMGLFPYYLYRQKNMAGNFENVGYAKPGYEGIYNILMMEELQSVTALGAGTVSKRVMPGGRIERCDTVKDLTSYIERVEEMIERKRALFCNHSGN